MKPLPSLAGARWLRAPSLRRLFRVIEQAGGEARVAGGAIRNALLGIPVADVDLATTLAPETVMDVCAAAGMSVHPTGIDHGTITVVADHHPYEVTTLRHDVETFGRRAKVLYTDDWQADAARRDFTMNALYCDKTGIIYDFTNGYDAILRKRIIFVGSASTRIEEDYLRILRFFRFHARFGRGAPDADGLAACVRHRKHLESLSAERIRQEMFKLLAAPGAVPTLRLMARQGILEHILPYTEEWRVLQRLPPDPVLRLAVLAADPRAMKACWRLSNQEARRIAAISERMAPTPALRPREQRAILYDLGAEAWRDLVHMAWARSRAKPDDPAWRRLLRLADRWPVPALPVSGHDLINHGIAPGPAVGQTLRQLEDWWVASDFRPGRDELLQRLNP
ncbi:MAG: CCA tRNA nucleotidyltransferase [Alphaproteobacteria bacterium]|nr:CCA tRNA nucleotidyltransferase [Alphaproteobacteria bacterium]